MSERPTPTIVAPPEAPVEERAGCASPLTLGCALSLLLLLVGSAILTSRGDRIFRWGLDRTRATVLGALPQDVTAEERARLEAAFGAVAAASSAGEVDAERMERLRATLREALVRVRDGVFDREDAVALSERLEEIADGRQQGERSARRRRAA